MLSEERNRLLCETGPRTPTGALLRRYWHPIAGAAEFRERTVKPVRILGDDLTLYRDPPDQPLSRTDRRACRLSHRLGRGGRAPP